MDIPINIYYYTFYQNEALFSPKYTNCSYNSISKKQPNQKLSKRPKQTFLQRRHTNGQQANEKVFNIDNY